MTDWISNRGPLNVMIFPQIKWTGFRGKISTMLSASLWVGNDVAKLNNRGVLLRQMDWKIAKEVNFTVFVA